MFKYFLRLHGEYIQIRRLCQFAQKNAAICRPIAYMTRIKKTRVLLLVLRKENGEQYEVSYDNALSIVKRNRKHISS